MEIVRFWQVFGSGSRIDRFVHLFLYFILLSSPLTREKACRINKLVLVNPVRRVRQADLCNMTMFQMQEINTRHCSHNTRGPRGPWNAHLRVKIFKSSLFSLLYIKQATPGGVNLKLCLKNNFLRFDLVT